MGASLLQGGTRQFLVGPLTPLSLSPPGERPVRAQDLGEDSQDEDVALMLVHRQRPVRLFLADLVSLVGGVLKQFYWDVIHTPYNIPTEKYRAVSNPHHNLL